jgi:hypothetical protein
MSTDNVRFKDEALVKETHELHDLHMKFKDMLCGKNVRWGSTIPERGFIHKSAQVFTETRNNAFRLLKMVERVEKKTTRTIEPDVYKIDPTMAAFLHLKERGLSVEAYERRVSLSYFANYVVCMGMKDGKHIKLDGPGGQELKELFGTELRAPGSGPALINEDGSKSQTSVLDADGNQINSFEFIKFLTIASPHFIHAGGKLVRITRQSYPSIYEQMVKEKQLMTVDLKKARTDYESANDLLADLKSRKDKALALGDRAINERILAATKTVRSTKMAYISIMDANKIPHKLSM